MDVVSAFYIFSSTFKHFEMLFFALRLLPLAYQS